MQVSRKTCNDVLVALSGIWVYNMHLFEYKYIYNQHIDTEARRIYLPGRKHLLHGR